MIREVENTQRVFEIDRGVDEDGDTVDPVRITRSRKNDQISFEICEAASGEAVILSEAETGELYQILHRLLNS